MNRIAGRVATAAAMLLGLGQVSAAELLDYIPADSEVVVSVKVSDLINRPVVQELWKSEMEEGPAGAGVRMVERMTGVNITRDIQSVIIAGQVDREEMGLALVKATFDEQALLDIVRLNPTYSQVEVEGMTMHRWDDDGGKYGVFLPDGVILVGNSEARVREALTTTAGEKVTFAKTYNFEAPAGADAWLWLRRPEREGSDLGEGMQTMGLKSVVGLLTFESNEVVLESGFEPDRPADAADHRAVLDGMLGVARLQQQEPMVAEIARMSKTETRDGRPVLTTRIPNDVFSRLIHDAIERNR
jgi:hypothetical protein